MQQKRVFKVTLVLLVMLLLTLPFLVTFNEALTKAIEKIGAYAWIQEKLVPYEVGMVGILTSPFGISFKGFANGMLVNGTFLQMTWNCIGWQSLLLLTITLFVGLRSGSYTSLSKLEAVVIGILGTFLMNLLRLSLIVLIWAYAKPIYFYVYHDYLSAVSTIIWLFIFWWFSYSYILEERPQID